MKMKSDSIVWTVSRSEYCLELKTKNANADEEDKAINLPELGLFKKMSHLSQKYSERGYAVLFDVE